MILPGSLARRHRRRYGSSFFHEMLCANGHAVIVCNWDAVRHGCVYGTHEELLSIDDLLPLERSP